MPGPRAKPPELRLVEGTRSDHPDLNRPTAPPSTFPDAPAWFQPEATKLYHETIRRLGEIDVASEVDTDFVITYVMAVMMQRECERVIARVGLARSRKYKMWEGLNRRVIAMSKELGLTPAARSGMRIKPNEPAPAVKDLFAS